MMIGIEWRGDTEPGAGVTLEAGDTNGAWGLLRARPGDIFDKRGHGRWLLDFWVLTI